MENRKTVDQRRLRVSEFFELHSKDLARQGSLVASYRTRGDQRLGPYYRLTFRDSNQRQISIYIGNDEQLIAEVRGRLHGLQNSIREHRQWTDLRRSVRRAARATREQLRSELSKKGLLLKGHEIRGWRLQASQSGPDVGRNELAEQCSAASPESPSTAAADSPNPLAQSSAQSVITS